MFRASDVTDATRQFHKVHAKLWISYPPPDRPLAFRGSHLTVLHVPEFVASFFQADSNPSTEYLPLTCPQIPRTPHLIVQSLTLGQGF